MRWAPEDGGGAPLHHNRGIDENGAFAPPFYLCAYLRTAGRIGFDMQAVPASEADFRSARKGEAGASLSQAPVGIELEELAESGLIFSDPAVRLRSVVRGEYQHGVQARLIPAVLGVCRHRENGERGEKKNGTGGDGVFHRRSSRSFCMDFLA